jgi:uncharacterized protein YgbK (DUF1537 family)
LYIKLDSTLRGNVAAALGAARALHPGHSVVFCPAYPAQGRTVIAGQVLVHGEPLCPRSRADESLEPVVSGQILSVLNRLEGPLRHVASVDELYSLLRRSEAGMIVCCDARTDDDLRDIWAVLAELEEEGTPPVVLAGSAGLLAAKFQKSAGIALDTLRGRKWIVVGGSMNPISREQLLQSPWTIFRPPAPHADVLGYLSGHDGVVLATPSEPSQEAVTSWLLTTARGILENGAASGLIVFGGDTASALLAACGIWSLEPAGEVLPGVPCSWIILGNSHLALITKAGGFGAPDLLNRMIGEINKI